MSTSATDVLMDLNLEIAVGSDLQSFFAIQIDHVEYLRGLYSNKYN